MQTRANHLLLTLLIVVVGICKITVLFLVWTDHPSHIFAPDSASYLETARAFLQTGCFAISPDKPNVPQIERTPGYPFFLASFFWGFGESYFLLILIQILLSLGTIFITYRLASRLWGDRIAIVAALLLALDFPSFMSSHQVLTETLFTLVLSMAVLTGISVLKPVQHVVPRVLLFSSLFSLATLIRPITYYAMLVVGVVFINSWRITWPWPKIGRLLVTFSIPWLMLVGGWQLRNYLVAGTTAFSAIQGGNLLFYRGAAIVAQRDGIAFEEAQQRLGYGHYAERHPETKAWSLAQLNQRWQQEGMALIQKYPWLFVKIQLWGAAKMMFGPGENALLGFWGQSQEKTGPGGDFLALSLKNYIRKWVFEKTSLFAFFCFSEMYLVALYGGVLCSVQRLLRTNDPFWRGHLLIWGIIIYLMIVSAGPGAYSRFRIPLMPLLSVYAAHGLYQIASGRQDAKNRWSHRDTEGTEK